MKCTSSAKSRMDANMQLTINSFRSHFPDNIFSLTLPWLLVKSLTFHWQLSNSQYFQVFQTSGHPDYMYSFALARKDIQVQNKWRMKIKEANNWPTIGHWNSVHAFFFIHYHKIITKQNTQQMQMHTQPQWNDWWQHQAASVVLSSCPIPPPASPHFLGTHGVPSPQLITGQRIQLITYMVKDSINNKLCNPLWAH